MKELRINPYLSHEAEIINKDREYECVKWMSISKASVAIADLLQWEQFNEWHREGLLMAQEVIKEYSAFMDMLASDKLLMKKEA